jgi:type II secretory pathway component PulC
MAIPLPRLLSVFLLVWAACGLAQAAAQPSPAPQPPPASTLPIELVGVMVQAEAPMQSTCLVRCTFPADQPRTAILEVGQAACALAEIREIRADSVIVRHLVTNRLERIALRTSGDSSSTPVTAARPTDAEPPPPRVLKTATNQVTVEMPKATVTHYLANLPDLLSSALATPRYVDAGAGPRSVDGFELSQIREGSVADRVGLRNGDVIAALNGERLDSVATVLRLFGQAQTLAQVKLTVERNGQSMSFTINTR